MDLFGNSKRGIEENNTVSPNTKRKLAQDSDEEESNKNVSETGNIDGDSACKHQKPDTLGLFSKYLPEKTHSHLHHPLLSTRSPAQLTIFYSGTVNVFDAVPADKAQAILIFAAATANANSNSKNGTAPVLTRSPSLHGTTVISPPSPQLTTTPNNPLCKLQADLPIARRHSLQRFLEKRRDRLVTKASSSPSESCHSGVEICSEKAGCISSSTDNHGGLPVATYLT